jgi:uncharacterized protein (TIGR01777 family)
VSLKKKAFIAGGTGFVGVNLANGLCRSGHAVTVMGRSSGRPPALDPAVSVIAADGRKPGSWQAEVRGSSVVINLAGASIFGRWTEKHKNLLRESRILTTRHIVDALPGDPEGVTLFSTSAVGYYGFHGDEVLSEDSGPGDDFLARLCRDWEFEAAKARNKGVRVVITRFGLVLGRNGGVLGQMLLPFRCGLGGPIGDGRQWFSWVHMEDLVGAFAFLLERPDASGPFNLTAPAPVRNGDLARSLGKVLHRPAIMPAPAPLVRLFLGEFGSVILQGQRVMPARLLQSGFEFRHGSVTEALKTIVG